jgi:hypothetical protein
MVALMVYGLAITFGIANHLDRRKPVPSGHRVVTAAIPPRSPPAPTVGAGGDGAGAEPAWSLPGPSRYEGVAAVGYPHTTLGAVALGYSALAARFTTDPDIAVSVVRATVMAPTTTLLEAVAQGTEALRSRFGMAPTGPTPATIGLSLVACQVSSSSLLRVVAGYEGTLSVEGGSIQGATAEVSAAIVIVWDGHDWKIDPTADLPTPAIEFPGSGGATTAGGWHVCAEV